MLGIWERRSRSLALQGALVAALAWGFSSCGCSASKPGPGVGDILPLPDGANFYFDEGLFKQAAEVVQAKGWEDGASSLQDFMDGRAGMLKPGSTVRIVRVVPGGFHAQVVTSAKNKYGGSGPRMGRLGWLVDPALLALVPKEKPHVHPARRPDPGAGPEEVRRTDSGPIAPRRLLDARVVD